MFAGPSGRGSYEGWEGSNESSNGKESRFSEMENIRSNRHVTKRGGWVRLLVIIVVVLILVLGIALGVGLGLGLRKKNSSSME